MTVSRKIRASIENASWIRKMFEEGEERKARFGSDNVFDFSLGNPNLEPPPRFKEVLAKLAADPAPGRHAYMPNAGYLKTRQAVADHLNRFNRETFTADDIIMTVGAGGGLNVVFKTILDPADEVIIPGPYFVEYNFYLDNHQAVPRVVATEEDFSLNLDAVEEAVTEKTRAVLVNSPNNPTGKVYAEKELKDLAELLTFCSNRLGRPIYLISDEPYRKIVYDDVTVPGIPDIYEESFVVTSFSKDLSLPGERIGYIAAGPGLSDKTRIVSGMVFCNRILGYVNAPAFMQRAIVELLEENVDISAYQKNRDRLCDGLTALGYDLIKPEGAFYLFPKAPGEDDLAFVKALQEKNILTVPGRGFEGPGYFRIAYCVSDATIEGALPGFEQTIRQFTA